MKKLIAIFSLALLGYNIYGIGPQVNEAFITVGSQSGSNFDQFYHNIGSYNDQSFDYNFSESITGSSVEWKMTQSSATGRVTKVYIPASSVTVSGTNVTWALARSNMPPVGIYQAELYATDGGNSPGLSIARGKINVTESLFDSTSDTFTLPVITNYYDFVLKSGDFDQFIGLTGSAGEIWVSDGAGGGSWQPEGAGAVSQVNAGDGITTVTNGGGTAVTVSVDSTVLRNGDPGTSTNLSDYNNDVPFIKADGSVDFTGDQSMADNGLTSIGRLDFSEGSAVSPVAGRFIWDATKDNFVAYNSRTNTSLDVGYEGRLHAKNNTGATITNGYAVYVDGIDGGIKTVALADCNTFNDSRVIGLATEDIPDGVTGEVVLWGDANDTPWTGLANGTVYLSDEPGVLSNTRATGGCFSVIIGKHLGSGNIFVNIDRSELAVEVTDTNGFPPDQRTGTDLTFTNATRTFSIAPTGAMYHYYDDGQKFEKETGESIQIGPEEGLHVVYYSGDVLSTLANPNDGQIGGLIRTEALVGYVYWDSTNSQKSI